MKTIYEMELHEILNTTDLSAQLAAMVTKVPGGWIYIYYDKSNSMMSSAFVPFDNEFQISKIDTDEQLSSKVKNKFKISPTISAEEVSKMKFRDED